MFARREAKTRIQQRDWLAKKFAASSTNHVAGFLFSLRVARTNSPSGKRALGIFDLYIQVVIICQELKKFVVCCSIIILYLAPCVALANLYTAPPQTDLRSSDQSIMADL